MRGLKALTIETGLARLEIEGECPKHGHYVTSCFVRNGQKIGVTGCPKCDLESLDAERAAEAQKSIEAMEKAREDLINKGRDSAGIPKIYAKHSFSTFERTTEAQETAYQLAHSWAGSLYRGNDDYPFLIICGSIGTGKTHLAVAALKAVLNRYETGLYVTASEMLRRLTDTWDKNSPVTTSDVLQSYIGKDVLVIDEIGRVLGVSNRAESYLFDVIEQRYREMKPTIFVSNIPNHELEKVLDPAILSRLREVGVFLTMNWSDYRKKIAEENKAIYQMSATA